MIPLIWIGACRHFHRISRLAGSGRVDARIVLPEDDEALKLPLTVLSRDNERWTVFVEECGRLSLCDPSLGFHFVRSWASLRGRFWIIP